MNKTAVKVYNLLTVGLLCYDQLKPLKYIYKCWMIALQLPLFNTCTASIHLNETTY